MSRQARVPEGLPPPVRAPAGRVHSVHFQGRGVQLQEGVGGGPVPQHHLLRAGPGAAEGTTNTNPQLKIISLYGATQNTVR
jgi:hypothetical protein